MATVVGTDSSKVLRATCHNCASIVEYTPSETRAVTSRDISGDSDTYHYLNCPKCGKDMSVSIYN